MRVLHRFPHCLHCNQTRNAHSLLTLFLHSSFAVQSEEHEPAQHLSVATQRCHHIGTGCGSGYDSIAGHGATAKAYTVAAVALRGGAASLAEVRKTGYPYELINNYLYIRIYISVSIYLNCTSIYLYNYLYIYQLSF